MAAMIILSPISIMPMIVDKMMTPALVTIHQQCLVIMIGQWRNASPPTVSNVWIFCACGTVAGVGFAYKSWSRWLCSIHLWNCSSRSALSSTLCSWQWTITIWTRTLRKFLRMPILYVTNIVFLVFANGNFFFFFLSSFKNAFSSLRRCLP